MTSRPKSDSKRSTDDHDDRLLPLLRWAGGKQHATASLIALVPPRARRPLYWEPFVGGGSVFFALRPARACLADSNPDLINCYSHVRNAPEMVAALLASHASNDCADYYYRIRAQYNEIGSRASRAQAARFLYLNRTCFNGIFRVNHQGQYNVPYGHKSSPRFPDRVHFQRASEALQSVN